MTAPFDYPGEGKTPTSRAEYIERYAYHNDQALSDIQDAYNGREHNAGQRLIDATTAVAHATLAQAALTAAALLPATLDHPGEG